MYWQFFPKVTTSYKRTLTIEIIIRFSIHKFDIQTVAQGNFLNPWSNKSGRLFFKVNIICNIICLFFEFEGCGVEAVMGEVCSRCPLKVQLTG